MAKSAECLIHCQLHVPLLKIIKFSRPKASTKFGSKKIDFHSTQHQHRISPICCWLGLWPRYLLNKLKSNRWEPIDDAWSWEPIDEISSWPRIEISRGWNLSTADWHEFCWTRFFFFLFWHEELCFLKISELIFLSFNIFKFSYDSCIGMLFSFCWSF